MNLCHEKIDELRELLDLPDRARVSVTMLRGQIETTDYTKTYRSFAASGDEAFVIVGPADKLNGSRIEHQDGSITYTFTLKGPGL